MTQSGPRRAVLRALAVMVPFAPCANSSSSPSTCWSPSRSCSAQVAYAPSPQSPCCSSISLLISNRSRQRAPNLTSIDRFVLGLTTLFVSPRRIPKLGALIKPATLFKFHKALVDRKYRLLFSSSAHRRKPGPKGPSAELIAAIVEMKRRNPQVSAACASPSRSLMPSASRSTKMSCAACSRSTIDQATPDPWPVLADVHRARQGQPLERGPVPLRIDPPAQSLGDVGHGRVHPPHHRLRRRTRQHRRRLGMPDVQSRHRRPAPTETRQHRPRPAVSLSPLARQPARPRDRGDQVGSVRSGFASVRRTADRHDPPRVSRSRVLLERDGPGAKVGRIRGLLQRASRASLA